MKTLILLFSVLFITMSFAQVPNYVPTNGLVGWWPFNGNANDESGNGNNGTVNGATLTIDRNGVANQAYTFDVNQKIGTFITNFPVYSVSIWAKINTWNLGIGTFNGGALASHKTDGLYGNGFGLEHNGINNQNQWSWFEYNGNNYVQQFSGIPQLSTWFHVVLTSDSQGTRNLYINGLLTDTYNGGIIISGGNNYEFKIGALIDGSTTWWFKGDLDDVGYWNRALAECEIQNLYTSSIPTNTTTAAACDSYTWNGTSYTASGVYTGTTANCVTESLNLTIIPSSTNTTTASACDSYSWNGTTYTATGVYTGTTANCVTESLNLTITPNPTAIITATGPLTFCSGGSVVLTASGGTSYLWSNGATTASITATTSGIYYATVTNANGCSGISNSIVVTVIASPTAIITPTGPLTFCSGGSVVLTASGGTSYSWSTGATTQAITATTAGLYTVQVTDNVNGCISLSAPTVLTITPSSTNTTTVSACNNYTWNGTTYTTSGVYSGTTTNCVTQSLNLTINTNTSSSISQTALDSYTWPVNNQTYTTTGAYTTVIPNASGCDSTITLNLTMSFTGINDLSASKLSIYPNPTNGDFTITGLELVGTVSSLSLTDMNGKVVKVLDTKATKFSMASIKPGVYFLNIISGNKQEVLKIVKE